MKREFTPKMKYDPDVDPNELDPCCFCLVEDECLATDDECSIAREFWEIWEAYSDKMDAFIEKVNKKRHGE